MAASEAASAPGDKQDQPTDSARHPPPAPPPPRKLYATRSSEADAELESLSSMMTTFKWQDDAVEVCAKAILDPTSSQAAKQKGVLQLKQLLCTSREHVFRIAQDVIDSGVLKQLVSFISEKSNPVPMRLASAFCLTNIAAGRDDQTAAVVAAGAIPPCLELLKSPEESLRRQAVFCLANIAGSTAEFRRMLACHSQYFDLLIFAVNNSTDVKMEELGGWNIRNMCVLGGPDYEQVRPGIVFFARQLLRNSPEDITSLLTNGAATFLSVTNSYNPYAPSQCFKSGSGYIYQHVAMLRFACETFSWISRSAEGRLDIINNDLVLPLLYHTKFSPNSSVRSYSAETLANLAQYGGARNELESSGAVIALSELLADHVTYPPHQRVLAARCLYWICTSQASGVADIMVDHNVVTRDTAIKILAHAKTHGNLATEDDLYDSTYPSYLPNGIDPEVARGASTLEIAYVIFNQRDRPEEFSLREKCGRLLIAILSKVSEPVLCEAVSPDTFRLILDILDLAVDVDIQTCLMGGEATSALPIGASSMDALKMGEPELPPAHFVLSVLQLLERFFEWGQHLRHREHIVDNPIAILLRQCDGFQRIENVITHASLPYQVIQQAMNMIQMYCHP
eukprot:Blabericola_migrator_1__1179@NODE_12_length_24658_cov_176_683258_g9_i0_p3_GENE_NODE_12_length_24658_cov_176_683258_g9_i0NODE_12_length_24658_cov_176_683258_g9_i0_p3_ORF_typecomplete_len624_score87_59Arm/PF00514_23/0_0066Arm/PF00514_23/1_8e11Arm/PF00514_23/2_8Arm/PF00514_23/2_8e03Arm/PF00514_23/1_3e04Arm_2/PF04826_13/1_1e05Arm_2/PF04826_13/11Arm_2/PF04826_13/9_7e02HEAT_2/PF13646_6/0_0012HEAT_2/PF13646_6/2_1HEAT_2/PF13646_6/0_56KAP/PF05804_12/0_006KAP/PF05804_12/0_097Proteasom_PSMB/PF10508_9/0_55P